MDCVWSAASSQKAITAGPSAALAGSTQLASTCPSVSGSTRRLRPLKSLPARSPPGPRWASTRSARFACRGRRPWPRLFSARSRLLTFTHVLTHYHVPSASRLAKHQYTVPQGGKSPGKSRHAHPFLSTYKMAFTTSASGHLPRRRTTSSGSNCYQSRAAKSELYRFRVGKTSASFTPRN